MIPEVVDRLVSLDDGGLNQSVNRLLNLNIVCGAAEERARPAKT